MSMIDIKKCVEKLSVKTKSFRKVDNYVIIEAVDSNNTEKSYLIKKKGKEKEKVFFYLSRVDCCFYLPYLGLINDEYEVYLFYENKETDYYMKCKLMIDTLSKIHIKTMRCIPYTSEIIKDIFDKQISKIDMLKKYYFDMQDHLDESTIIRPDYLFMLNNISKFYKALDLAKEKINDWYNKEHKNYYQSFQVGYVSLNNFIINENYYFIDFDRESYGFIIGDIVEFYHNEFFSIDLFPLLEMYFESIDFDYDEMDLFYSYIALPKKIEFIDNCYENCIHINNAIKYIDKTIDYILKKDKENEEANQQEFKE